MLLVTIISLAWTTWLIVLAIAPTPTANCLMDTEGYDDGRFWLIVDPDPSMVVLSVLGLGTVTTGYLRKPSFMHLYSDHRLRVSPCDFLSNILRSKPLEATYTYNGEN
uniref:Uncharacterized protein n=1 Tax=Globisporangium ultimum (strain ATCC 200006 / CBS 805.95 / DAOM BR144) TaxID=431595 RepID=K3X7V6_GLOUD